MFFDLLFGDGMYLPQLYQVLLILALFCMATDDNLSFDKSFQLLIFPIVFVLFTIQSITLIQQYVLPLSGAIFLAYIIDNRKKENYFKDKNFNKMLQTVLSIILLTIVSVGLHFFIFRNAKYVRSTAQSVTVSPQMFFQNLQYLITYIPYGYFGIKPGVLLISFDGLLNMVKFILSIIMYCVLPVLLYIKRDELSSKKRLFLFFCLIFIATTIIILLFNFKMVLDTDANTLRYLLVSFQLLIILSGCYINEYILKKSRLGRHIVVFILLFYALVYITPRLSYINSYKNNIVQKREITDYLKSKGLHYGYSSYWNANNNTVLSNFAVEFGSVVYLGNKIVPFNWLSSKHSYESSNYVGKTFVLMTDAENEESLGSLKIYGAPMEVLSHNGYVIYVYDYNIANNNFNGSLKDMDLRRIMYFEAQEPIVGNDGSLIINSGRRIYGPYLYTPMGKYTLDINI
jgi:hypothetical protein